MIPKVLVARVISDKLSKGPSVNYMSIDIAKPGRKLFEELPRLWEESNLTKLGTLLTAMLDAVYAEAVD